MTLLWDLSAAFDTLDHSIFLGKLRSYGFNEESRKWFCSYLKDRQQYVDVSGTTSSVKKTPRGSPQGAICSPLIFTIYIADMPLWTRDSSIMSYADDTSSTISRPEIKDALQRTEEDAQRMMAFMNTNYLVANASKTKLIIFRPRHNNTDKRESVKIGSTQSSVGVEKVYVSLAITLN